MEKMFIKYCFITFVIMSAVNCQRYVRVRRQGSKGGRYPSPDFVTQQKDSGDTGGYGSGPTQLDEQRPYSAPQPQEEEKQYNSAEGEAAPEPPIYGGVMGTPGVDFPAYTQIPKTNFKCAGLPYEPGMYADEQTQCQAYHICFQGRKESFLCGVGTVFNQAILGCDYWHSVDCSQAPNFYSMNEQLGKAGPEPSPGQSTRPAAPAPSAPLRPVSRPPPVYQSQEPFDEPEPEVPQIKAPPRSRPQPPRYQPPVSKASPAFPQRPAFRPPPPSKVQPIQRPVIQQQEKIPFESQLPYRPLSKPVSIGKTSPPRPRPQITEPQTQQRKDDEPLYMVSWLGRDSYDQQQQQQQQMDYEY